MERLSETRRRETNVIEQKSEIELCTRIKKAVCTNKLPQWHCPLIKNNISRK